MFVLIYPFTSQIFCISNDIMQRFTYNEKNRDDLLQYNGSISHLGKMARTSAKSENPNAPVVNRRVRGRSLPWITLTIQDLMKKRDYHHKKAIKTNKEPPWSSYKRLRNAVSMKLRKEKASYYSN